MPDVKIIYRKKEYHVKAERGDSLMRVIQQMGIGQSFPCGGNHNCGKCMVLSDGKGLSACDSREKELLNGRYGVRLACFSRIEGDCEIRITEENARIQTEGKSDIFSTDPIYRGDYGIAIDIGTTTVAGYLYRKDRIKAIAVKGELNQQRVCGADVISRIQYCSEHGVEELSRIIRKQLDEMMVSLCRKADIAEDQIGGAVICGNTTMLHLLTGLHPKSMAVAPYRAPALFGCEAAIGLRHFANLPVYLPECMSAYVGADITCSVLSADMKNDRNPILLLDIGTNGEIALWSGDRLYCCATAAGPAFEGAGISCGSGAVPGAITHVRLEDGALQCSVMDAIPAKSICGSGIIDAIAAALDYGMLRANGKIEEECEGKLSLTKAVFLNQEDIRNVQYAKAAIRAGIEVLLDEAGVLCRDLERVMICGGFGSNISARSAERIGMLPPGTADKSVLFGNGAGIGAGQILQSKEKRKTATEYAAKSEIIELSASAEFMEKYIENMNF